MENKKNVYIIGADLINKGGEAMLLTLAEAIRSRNTKLSIYIPVRFEYADIARHFKLCPLIIYNKRQLFHKLKRIFYKLKRKIDEYHLYKNCLAVLNIGGYQFGDKWGVQKAKKIYSKTKKARLNNVPVYYLPQAWGPFADPRFKDIMPEIIDEAAMLFVRDNISRQCITSISPESALKCRFSHDIAWVFKGGRQEWAIQYLGKKGINIAGDNLSVCVTPNMRMYEKYDCDDSENPYLNYLSQLIKHLAAKDRTQILIMGHELKIHHDKHSDDRYLCQYLSKKIGLKNVWALDDYLSAADIKAILGCCDLVISSRYHALIAALSQGVVSIALGWSHKYDELMKSAGMESFILKLEEGINKNLVDNAIESRSSLSEQILNHIPTLKKSAKKTLDDVVTSILS